MDPSIASFATHLNNEGVHCLEAGCIDEAIARFTKGLATVKEVLAVKRNFSENCRELIPPPQEPQASSGLFCKLSEPVPMEISDCQEMILDDKVFIFSNPMFIPTQATKLTCLKHYVQVSFIILYNLALAHHLGAIRNGWSIKRLRKALSLYEVAYTIEITEDIGLTVLQNMAIVNNLGQIHATLKNYEKSNQCFEHLLSTIMFLNDCGEREVVAHLDGFLANVMPLILKNSASAPAA